ncbi:hypothetical protein M8C21_007127 [Ambrosia artemisiifolia]|uniref:Uncharacterized protein n=1 Tax=Ambrosia artemisiifolia TaxID=4212 RepID=A0AAD5BRC1_AMBAR|nr:hypothetical protein M8C21_007127 [Ambrosia artemisiifolia]
MEQESRNPFLQSNVIESANKYSSRINLDIRGRQNFIGPGFPGLKKRGQTLGNRSWLKIEQNGNSRVVELDKATIMRHCSLPPRDLCLLDPLFIYPSPILGREKAIVREKYHSGDLPFEFKALELALEFACLTLDTQLWKMSKAGVGGFKGHLLALTQRVQKVCDEIEHLMNDDGDTAEMKLTEKKQRNSCNDLYDQVQGNDIVSCGSTSGAHNLQRAFSNVSAHKHGSLLGSSVTGETKNIDQLEMLLEAYFIGIDNTLNKLLSDL